MSTECYKMFIATKLGVYICQTQLTVFLAGKLMSPLWMHTFVIYYAYLITPNSERRQQVQINSTAYGAEL